MRQRRHCAMRWVVSAWNYQRANFEMMWSSTKARVNLPDTATILSGPSYFPLGPHLNRFQLHARSSDVAHARNASFSPNVKHSLFDTAVQPHLVNSPFACRPFSSDSPRKRPSRSISASLPRRFGLSRHPPLFSRSRSISQQGCE